MQNENNQWEKQKEEKAITIRSSNYLDNAEKPEKSVGFSVRWAFKGMEIRNAVAAFVTP